MCRVARRIGNKRLLRIIRRFLQADMMQDGVCVSRDQGTPLEKKLRLRVNREKSAVAPVGERKFLGHRLLLNGKLGIASKSIKRAKEKIRQITRRNRGVSLAQVIVELNLFLVGWITYYRYAACRFELQCLDEWIRRKLRCYRLKQRKRGSSVAGFLRQLGVSAIQAGRLAVSGKGPWRLALTRQANTAMSVEWFSSTRARFTG